MAFTSGADADGTKMSNIELRAVGDRAYGDPPLKNGESLEAMGTDYKDQANMERLGKRQEFDVGLAAPTSLC